MDSLSQFSGLYLHIPFCHARCGYCDFASTHNQSDLIPSYLDALGQEMERARGFQIKTLFIGGGTPSVLSPQQISQIHQRLKSNFDLNGLVEATVELNPESVTKDKLGAFGEMGINRLSFGLQTTDNKGLRRMDRLHTFETFLEVWELAHTMGFQNCNVDLIYGMPGQTIDEWRGDLEKVIALHPTHISTYGLKIETGTPFQQRGMVVNDDAQSDMYLFSSEFLRNQGYRHYEVSNFCQPGYACRHNLNYWENGNFVGLGVSSASHIKGMRRQNTGELTRYINGIKNMGQCPYDETTISGPDLLKETMMLKLRLENGVNWNDIEPMRIPETQKFLDLRWAVCENGFFRLQPEGWLLSNQLFQHFV
jgi:oxygen-independent coproporphyrinogen-3 oxidase